MNKGILINKNNPASFLSVEKAPDDFSGVPRVYGTSAIIISGYCHKSGGSSVYRCSRLFIYFRYPHANEVFLYSFSFLRRLKLL